MVKKKGPKRKKNVRKKAVGKNTDVYSYKSSSESDHASSLPPTQKYHIPPKAKNTSILPSDLSSILKVGTDPNEDDDLDEFDRPLHSTALEEEQPEMPDQSQEISPPKKRLEKRKNVKSNKNTDLKVKKSNKNSEKETVQSDSVRKKSKNTLTLLEPSLAPSVMNAARKAPKRKELSKAGPGLMADGLTSVQEFQSAASAGSLNSPQRLEELSSPNPTEEAAEQSEVPKGKKRKVVHENILNHSNRDIVCAGNVSVTLWCPDGMRRSSRDITELDIILAEFTNIVTNYKREVESVACIKAIDGFFSAVKEKLTETIEEVQKLKDLQRKNTKFNNGIAKTRKRLITVKDELLVTEPQLKQLQKEYVQLRDKMDSLKIATQFLTDLKELKKEYVEYRKKDPKEIEKYGISSLPAFLLESRSILSAENHLHTINSKLQHFLDQDNATMPGDEETSRK